MENFAEKLASNTKMGVKQLFLTKVALMALKKSEIFLLGTTLSDFTANVHQGSLMSLCT